jgi:hypothetical protein
MPRKNRSASLDPPADSATPRLLRVFTAPPTFSATAAFVCLFVCLFVSFVCRAAYVCCWFVSGLSFRPPVCGRVPWPVSEGLEPLTATHLTLSRCMLPGFFFACGLKCSPLARHSHVALACTHRDAGVTSIASVLSGTWSRDPLTSTPGLGRTTLPGGQAPPRSAALVARTRPAFRPNRGDRALGTQWHLHGIMAQMAQEQPRKVGGILGPLPLSGHFEELRLRKFDLAS